MDHTRQHLGWAGGIVYALVLTGCLPAVPADLITQIEDVDHKLIELGAPQMAPDEYRPFAIKWATLKVQAQDYEDVIRWPWESSDFENQLRQLHDEGRNTVVRVQERQASQRRKAETAITHLEGRFLSLTSHLALLGGHLLLGEKPAHTELLLKRARSFYELKDYARSIQTAKQAHEALQAQTALLSQVLHRYTDARQIARWKAMARDAVEWSRAHQSAAIVVSKADRELVLYKNGRKVLSSPVRLGFNGLKEKRFQGDGATPEGLYRVTALREKGETRFFKALVLDYPNAEDRRRFNADKQSGRLAPTASIGGDIEIHGGESELRTQTQGCIMLDDHHMSALFSHVSPGIPVTIVGALTAENAVASALAEFDDRQDALFGSP